MERTDRNYILYMRKIIAFMLIIAISISLIPTYQVDAQSVKGNFNKSYSSSGNQVDKLIAVANAQIGRTKKQMGYNVAWCAYFVSDCALLAGAGNLIPYNSNCTNLYSAVKRAGGREVSTPQKGDLIFYYCRSCGSYTHVGIMVDSTYSIEGNYSNKVVKGKHNIKCYRNSSHSTTVRKYLRPAYQTSTARKVALHTWISETGMGASATRYKNGQTYYLCYELLDMESGKRLDSVEKKNYTITETIYKPDGSVAATTKYNNDNNWIRWPSTDGGTYQCEVSISGDYRGTSRPSYTVPGTPKIQFSMWFSEMRLGEKATSFKKGKEYYLCYKMVDLNTNKALNEVSAKRYKIQESVYDPNGTQIKTETFSYSDKNCICFTAQKSGTYKGIVEIVEGYTGKISKEIKVEEPNNRRIALHSWISETGMGSPAKKYKNGQTYYLCYELTDLESGKRLDSVERKNYTITETIYKPDGSVAATTKYNNDNNWIRWPSTDGGTYRGEVSISGDYNGTSKTEYTVPEKPTIQLSVWLSETKMGEKITTFMKGNTYYLCYKMIDLKTNKALNEISAKGYRIQESVYAPDGTLAKSETYSYSDRNCIDFVAQNSGIYKGTVSLVEGYNGEINKNITVEEPEKPMAISMHTGMTDTEMEDSSQQKLTVESVQIKNELGESVETVQMSEIGKNISLKASVLPANIEGIKVTWSTSNAKVAAVNSLTGKVTAMGNGEAVITATVGEKRAACKITVCENVMPTTVPDNAGMDTTSGSKDLNTETDFPKDNIPGKKTLEIGDGVNDKKGNHYVITSLGSHPTLEFAGTKRKGKTITIESIVNISGISYKVTSIAPNALKNNKIISKVVIGKNVTVIGKRSFSGCKALKIITIKSSKLKKVGSNALKGISTKAKIKVPKKKLKSYKKLLKGKGQSKKVKIIK